MAEKKEIKVECCVACEYFHRLKHNFVTGRGFEESYCCDVSMHLPDSDEGWIQEISKNDICELFKVKK